MESVDKMELDINNKSIVVYKALASEIRLSILRTLAQGSQTASSLAETLNMTQSGISKNIKLLADANLISVESSDNKREKLLTLSVQDINIHLPESIYPEYHQSTYSIPVGNYFNIENILPSCGMVNRQHVIQRFDDPSTFLSAERMSAELLWFSSGEIEYQLPITIPDHKNLKLLDLSFEIASEFPGSNNNWPSDIQFIINDSYVGTFTVKGNFSDVRGKNTPSWWDNNLSQYGTLIQLRISDRNTGVNGVPISDFNLDQLNTAQNSTLKIKFKISKTANNTPHGLTLFGKHFGNYSQDILVKSYWV